MKIGLLNEYLFIERCKMVGINVCQAKADDDAQGIDMRFRIGGNKELKVQIKTALASIISVRDNSMTANQVSSIIIKQMEKYRRNGISFIVVLDRMDSEYDCKVRQMLDIILASKSEELIQWFEKVLISSKDFFNKFQSSI